MNHHHSAGPVRKAKGRLRRAAAAGLFATTAWASALLYGQTLGTPGSPPSRPADGAPPVQQANAPGVAPVGESSPELLVSPAWPGAEISTVWNTAGPRAEALLYDNGEPLDDYGDPASQLSNGVDPNSPWYFFAAAADDFILPAAGLPERSYHITRIRAAFMFFNGASGSEQPSDWTALYVAVYPNSSFDLPAGQPQLNGSYSGLVMATQVVPAASLTFETAGACRACFVVDIPVDFMLAKNVRYWLSLMPDYDAPPQTAWCLSSLNKNFNAQRGASFGPAFWDEIAGNKALCSNAPPAYTMKDVSFQIYGEELTADQGACCDRSTGVCTNVYAAADCSGPFQVFHPGIACAFVECAEARGACCDDTMPLGTGCTDDVSIASCVGKRFEEGTLCADLDPVCGTEEQGRCCVPGLPCQDKTPTQCSLAGGVWEPGVCAGFDCPPENDECENWILLEDGEHEFSTAGATTDGPPLNPSLPECAPVENDVWYRYVASCTGTVIVSLCNETNYNSALAVYNDCVCPPDNGSQVACDNDGCGSLGAGAVIAGLINQASYTNYLDNVLYTHDGDNRDALSGPEHDPAKDAIVAAFQGFPGLTVVQESFDYMSTTCHNVIATQLGTLYPTQYYVIGAHYDSAGTPGADDNASGVAGVLEIARVLSAYQTDYTIKYIAFDTEEYGLIGSEAYVAAHPSDDILGMISMDMIAHDPGGGVADIWGKTASNAIKLDLSDAVLAYSGGLTAVLQTETYSRSDHGPFQDAGYQACLLIEPDIDTENPCYHQACDSVDTPDYISYPYAVKMTRSAAGYLADHAGAHVAASAASMVSFDATDGTCFLIRVGGVAGATGTGKITVGCIPTASGACCHYDGTCTISAGDDCTPDQGETYHPGVLCDFVACPAYAGACCNESTGVCTDVFSEAECPVGAFIVFHSGQPCVAVGCSIVTGACCDDATGNCTENVNIADCQGPSERFNAGHACSEFDPPCSPPGACCLPDRTCVDTTEADCTAQDGTWQSGSCDGPPPVYCPPANDDCADATSVSNGSHAFDTLGASTDGPAINPSQPACTEVNQDVWFSYTALCSGLLTVSLCTGTTYDSALAVYDGCDCMPAAGSEIACDNDACGAGGASRVQLVVTMGHCYLIRVGGANAAAGAGSLTVTCTSAVTQCCRGDINSDGVIDGLDIQRFVNWLVGPSAPTLGTSAFCRADINQDFSLDLDDVQPFVDLLLAGAECPPPPTWGACCDDATGICLDSVGFAECQGPTQRYIGGLTCAELDPPCQAPVACCPGDTNGDSLLDGLDVQGLVAAIIFNPPSGTVEFCRADVNEDLAIDLLDAESLVAKLMAGELCPPPTNGACCDTWSGICRDVADVAECTGTHELFYLGEACAGISCLPTLGACCDDSTGDCTDDTNIADCQGPTQRFGEGLTCDTLSPSCTGPITCCPGDTNGDGLLDGQDVQGLIEALLHEPPLVYGTLQFCQADVNEDMAVDLLDRDALVAKLIAGEPCPPP